MLFNQDHIIKEELEAIRADILDLYNASGKRTSGEFEEGLETSYSEGKGTLSGYLYLGGRKPGKRPPISAIEDWIEAKGIKAVESEITTSQLAFLIARKIGEEGTKKENHLHVYNEVITPERIDRIIERVSTLNAELFVEEVTLMISQTIEKVIM